jgi:dethiobiotin synthetase
MSGVFVTGTDTEVGKTVAGCGLLAAVAERGLATTAYKPVAAGCRVEGGRLVNEDAEALQAAASVPLDLAEINPLALRSAIAPHLAAEEEGKAIDLDALIAGYRRVAARGDWTLVEGAGGWRVPVDGIRTLADLAAGLALPVVLVVGVRLGCLNHALLTAEAIAADGLRLAGWVANTVDPGTARGPDQVETLRRRLNAPLLGILPRVSNPVPAEMAKYLEVTPLVS